MKKEQYLSLILGMLLGVLIPLIIIGIVYGVFVLNSKHFTTNVTSSLILFTLGINTLVERIIFKRNYEFLSRGIIFSTLILAIYWVMKFQIYRF